MKSWHAANLSLWDAVRRIMSRTHVGGDELADLLVGASPIDERALMFCYDDGEKQQALEVMRAARWLLREWCQKGEVKATGYVGSEAKMIELIGQDWARRTEVDYEKSALRGNDVPPIRSIMIAASEIDRLCEELLAPPAAAESEGNTLSGGSEESEKAKGAKAMRQTPQRAAIERAVAGLNLTGIDLKDRASLSDQKLTGQIQDYCRNHGIVFPSEDTILRAVGRKGK